MKRKRNKDSLPRFTRGEEIFNAVSHIVGGGFGVVFLIVGVLYAHMHCDSLGIFSLYVYGICMILTYTMSAIYHFLRPLKAKKVFRIIDHCSIFLLIAGTYTPICLITLMAEPAWGCSLFLIVWSLSILGITFTAINLHKYKTFGQILYLALGWCIIFALFPLLRHIELNGFWWLLGGGIAYSIGVIFFAYGRRVRYFHSIFHLFVVLGSVLQFICILFYVIM